MVPDTVVVMVTFGLIVGSIAAFPVPASPALVYTVELPKLLPFEAFLIWVAENLIWLCIVSVPPFLSCAVTL